LPGAAVLGNPADLEAADNRFIDDIYEDKLGLRHLGQAETFKGPRAQGSRTDEPAERVDQEILETLLVLEDGHQLPIGLRVQAFIVK
jgi:hypothetical protein